MHVAINAWYHAYAHVSLIILLKIKTKMFKMHYRFIQILKNVQLDLYRNLERCQFMKTRLENVKKWLSLSGYLCIIYYSMKLNDTCSTQAFIATCITYTAFWLWIVQLWIGFTLMHDIWSIKKIQSLDCQCDITTPYTWLNYRYVQLCDKENIKTVKYVLLINMSTLFV